eukprot:436938-Prymnesium_polylepis.2
MADRPGRQANGSAGCACAVRADGAGGGCAARASAGRACAARACVAREGGADGGCEASACVARACVACGRAANGCEDRGCAAPVDAAGRRRDVEHSRSSAVVPEARVGARFDWSRARRT